jgi:hypothetical protein
MRKCDACGYLLFGEADNCKHCGATLADRLSPVLITSGAPIATPASVPPVPPVARTAAPLPAELGRSPIARDYWTPPPSTPVATKPKGSRGGLLVLIVIVSMAFGWVAVDRVLHGDSLPAGTSAYVEGHGAFYTSPDRTFDARFPSPPTVQQKQLAVATMSATLNLAQLQTDDYEIVAASMVLPISIPATQVDAALRDIMHEGAVATDGEVISEQRIVHDGVTGLEVRVEVPDGYAARLRVLSSGNRVYMLGVHAKRVTDRLYEALVSSFVMH